MSKEEIKKRVFEILNGGGTNGGLFVDEDDSEMIFDEIWMLFNTKDLPTNRVITFKTDKKDVWSGYFDSVKIEHEY